MALNVFSHIRSARGAFPVLCPLAVQHADRQRCPSCSFAARLRLRTAADVLSAISGPSAGRGGERAGRPSADGRWRLPWGSREPSAVSTCGWSIAKTGMTASASHSPDPSRCRGTLLNSAIASASWSRLRSAVACSRRLIRVTSCWFHRSLRMTWRAKHHQPGRRSPGPSPRRMLRRARRHRDRPDAAPRRSPRRTDFWWW